MPSVMSATAHSGSPRRPLRAPLRVLAVAAVLVVGACGDDDVDADAVVDSADEVARSADEAVGDIQDEELDSTDLVAVLDENGLASVATLLETVDLDEVTGGEPFTFFAPSDDAFLALDADTAADLLADPELVLDILRNHTLTQELPADELLDRGSVLSVFGTSLDIDSSGEVPTVEPLNSPPRPGGGSKKPVPTSGP